MGARERFVMTREYCVHELPTIQALIATHGDEWQPDRIKAPGNSDPTASRAIHNVDEWGDELAILREREAWLLDFIGFTLEIIEGVRSGLGEKFADVLDQRYIDGYEWRDVLINGQPINKRTGQRIVNVAFDWLDSVGMADVAGGRYEL